MNGFGTIRMQHAINHWHHFDVKHFERVMNFREGKSITTFGRKRGLIFSIVLYLLMNQHRVIGALTKKK